MAEEAPPKGDSNGKVMEEEEEDHSSSSEEEDEDILKLVRFAKVRPVDIPRCVEIEKASYPPEEAASKSSLQYRQHHAANYFRCALIGGNAGDMNIRGSLVDDEDREVIGFICATRCHEFVHEAMSTHHSDGPLLAIHSVVVTEEHRRIGIATAMLKDYVETMRSMPDDGVQKLVLMAKKNLLSFYVDCGFSVTRPSAIVHGKDKWYELELDLSSHKSTGCPYSIVDSFANVEVPGSGNPAAVVVLERKDVDPKDPELAKWMLLVAKEFNLSETAFVWQHENYKQGKQRHWYIRYFTPTLEVDLCGHATLAAAAVVYRTHSSKSSDTAVAFHARNDVLTTKLSPGGPRWVKKRPNAKISMQFPIKLPVEIQEPEHVSAVQKMLWEALKVPSDVILFIGHTGIGDVFVELAPDAFERIGYNNIQYNAFCAWDGYTRGVVVCCCAKRRPLADNADGGINDTTSNATPTTPQTPEAPGMETPDFFSRFFAPKAGINEDPATGSSHCSLGPYFSKKIGKERVLGKQTSERGAIVECRVGGGDTSTVTIIGVGAQTMTGNLLL